MLADLLPLVDHRVEDPAVVGRQDGKRRIRLDVQVTRQNVVGQAAEIGSKTLRLDALLLGRLPEEIAEVIGLRLVVTPPQDDIRMVSQSCALSRIDGH